MIKFIAKNKEKCYKFNKKVELKQWLKYMILEVIKNKKIHICNIVISEHKGVKTV
jgi:hypothetical protein